MQHYSHLTKDYDAIDIIKNQILLYKDYIGKDPYREGANLLSQDLNELEKRVDEDSIINSINELLDIFNGLQEYGFRIGRAKYPGPTETWKRLVERYLPDFERTPYLFY